MSKYLDKEGLAQLWAKMKKYIADKDIKTAIPVGGSITWYGPENTIPSDWMREDGRSLNKNDYPDLFAVIGYTYGGSGDNFNIPNSKGRVITHLDGSDMFKNLGQIGGVLEHTHGSSSMIAGIQIFTGGNNDRLYLDWNERGWAPGFQENKRRVLWGNGIEDSDTHNETANAGLGIFGDTNSSTTLQPYIVAYRIIKVKEDAYSKNLRNLDNAIIQVEEEITTIKNKLNKFTVDSSNYIVTPNVNITKDYAGSGTYLQERIPLNTPWANKQMDRLRYFKLRVIYIQNTSYNYPWNEIAVGRVQGGDSWSKRLGLGGGVITEGPSYNIYEAIFSYNSTEIQNSDLVFIWEHRGCGCTIQYIEFYEVTPLLL